MKAELRDVRIAKFWSLVNKNGTISRDGTPCWEWLAGTSSGYGTFRLDSKQDRTHRISWLIHYGFIPEGLWVLHKCDNRRCVKPIHLFLGTRADNVKDAFNKGRLVVPRPDNSGQNNGRAVLTQLQVNRIREIG